MAAALGVPVEVVERSLRLAPPLLPVAAESPAAELARPTELTATLDVALGPGPRAGDDGPPAPLPASEREVLGRVLTVGPRLVVRRLLRPASWRALNYVEDDLAWPPAPAEGDRWQVVPVSDGPRWARAALREVVLWDQLVLVDDERRVLCPVCRRLVPVVELGRDLFQGVDGMLGGNIPKHRLALPARPAPEGAA